ncbi:hypothetical protein D9611_013634 [Ephemerocybe angulata]|uniref:Chitin synthase n=1 Tax=Ephemerocybe angulata TaxID=980116 RepID=A0A8H5ARI4_9AGAR|nr:hypothetical protein D9611_013634 [Tulosesus angulatus]
MPYQHVYKSESVESFASDDTCYDNELQCSLDDEKRYPPMSPHFIAPLPALPTMQANYPESPFNNYLSRASTIDLDSGWRRRQAIARGEKRKVKLTKGHFIAEYRVPTAICNAQEIKYTYSKSTEFSHMRYTAATCDPDDFTPENGWNLRTRMYNRETELLIAVTSFNEDKMLYARTLHNIMLNIRDICKTKKSKYWRGCAEEGTPAWQKITVALVVDGLECMDKSVLDLLATVGVYQDGIMKKKVDGKDTEAHIFEYTTQLSVDSTPQLVLPQETDDGSNLVPVQIILVVKAKNQKKINSHRWIFNAVGKQLNPEICVLVDAGTKPGHKSIYHLWEAFYNNENLGGCCGEIYTIGGKKLLNPLVAAQNFEYKMSNILDKPLESSFGYVSVLPGAFSAYRFRAIQGRPLEQYFHGDHSLAARLGPKGINGMSIFQKNMFLAEDRILCFELVAKQGEKWTLGYVKASTAETDVPETCAEFIGQRRRWLNGSFAASVYSLVHFWRIFQSGHNIFRLFFFTIQALYNALSLFFSWFGLANMWLTFSIIIDLVPKIPGLEKYAVFFYWFNSVMKYIYLGTLCMQFILALANRPKSERVAYTASFYVFAMLAVYLLACSFWLTGRSLVDIPKSLGAHPTAAAVFRSFFTVPIGPLVAAMVSTFGIYLFSSLLYLNPWHMFNSFVQYLILAPTFINILNVYAFCNLHDVSWGTKGSDTIDFLPSVKSKTTLGEDVATVEDITNTQEDIDFFFKETVVRALAKVEQTEVVEKTTVEDDNKTFRTHLVSAWLISNAILALAIQNLGGWLNINDNINPAKVAAFNKQAGDKRNIYFAFILYATLGLSLIRFIGCIFYWVRLNMFALCRRN